VAQVEDAVVEKRSAAQRREVDGGSHIEAASVPRHIGQPRIAWWDVGQSGRIRLDVGIRNIARPSIAERESGTPLGSPISHGQGWRLRR
jgi:hypothetical protein